MGLKDARLLPISTKHAGLRPEHLEDRACQEALDAAMTVHLALGPAHAAETYKNALVVELVARQLRVARDASFSVHYRAQIVGHFIADLVIEDRVLAQVSTTPDEGARREALRGIAVGDLKVGLLFNFGASELSFSRLL